MTVAPSMILCSMEAIELATHSSLIIQGLLGSVHQGNKLMESTHLGDLLHQAQTTPRKVTRLWLSN